jgi:prophage regulatory protein
MVDSKDGLPPPRLNRLVRPNDLPQYTGLKLTQITEQMKAGKFPKPVPLSDGGRAIGWLEDELIVWQHNRIAARDKAGAQTQQDATKTKVA